MRTSCRGSAPTHRRLSRIPNVVISDAFVEYVSWVTLNYWAFSVPSLGHELVGLHPCPDPLLHSAILSSFSTPPIMDLKEGVSR